MIAFRFPFRWGAPTPSVVTPVIPPLWTRDTVASQQWLTQGATQKRFEHIYPEGDTGPQFQRVTSVVS